jgi:hypothetical protein
VAAWDERGYLGFIRSGAGSSTASSTSFDEDDVEALGDNVVLMLETLRDLTQPEILQLLRQTAGSQQAPRRSGRPAALDLRAAQGAARPRGPPRARPDARAAQEHRHRSPVTDRAAAAATAAPSAEPTTS